MMTPLARLTRVHLLSTAADAGLAVALAGTLFFSVSTAAARSQMTLFLLLTLTPFALVTPFLGRVVERWSGSPIRPIAATGWARAGLALLIAADPLGLALLPASFAVLVFGRAYAITKRALVPTVVRPAPDLMGANAHLSRAGTVAAILGGATGTVLLHVVGVTLVLKVAAGLHVGAALLARGVRTTFSADGDPTSAETSRHVSSTLVRPVATMAGLRAAIGLLAFTAAFALRGTDGAGVSLGIVAVMVPIGSLTGTFVSPRLRRTHVDERAVLGGCSIVSAVVVGFTAVIPAGVGIAIAVLTVALATSVGRHAYDSLLQQEVGTRERSRVFARGEAVLQTAWVTGALVPTAWTLSPTAAQMSVAALLAVVAFAPRVRLPYRARRDVPLDLQALTHCDVAAA